MTERDHYHQDAPSAHGDGQQGAPEAEQVEMLPGLEEWAEKDPQPKLLDAEESDTARRRRYETGGTSI